jgi:hypothetical protein
MQTHHKFTAGQLLGQLLCYMEQLVPILQEFAVLRQLVSHAAPTVALAEDEDARRIVNGFVCEACKPRIPRVTFPPFLPAQALLGPPRRVLPIGAVPLLPSLPPGCNSSQSRC